MNRLSRRQLVQGAGVAGVALLAGCGRLPGQAAPPRVYRIGYLTAGSASSTASTAGPSYRTAFEQGLRNHGYEIGRNVVIETRAGEGRPERLAELAAELVALQVDVLVTPSTPSVQAAMAATRTIPIVMTDSGDPVGSGLVASLAHPGGNVTGLSQLGRELTPKRLQLLSEAVDGISRVAVLWNPDTPGNLPPFLSDVQEAAPALGIEHVQSLPARSAGELSPAIDAAVGEHSQALLVQAGPLFGINWGLIADSAMAQRLPAMAGQTDIIQRGGLLAYGPDFAALYRGAADYVDKILKGTKPADLPVEQPMKFDFAINLKTAQALGLTIPQHVLLQATEVLQ